MSDRGECSACGKRLIWAISPTGARSPINHEPSADGNVLLLQPTGLGEVLAVVLSKGGLEMARNRGLDLRLNHFADCPNREEFQR